MIVILALLSILTQNVSSIDIGTNGEHIILQTDVETILITTPMREIKGSVREMKRKIKTLKTTVMASPPNTIQKERTAIDKNLFGIITNCERITGTTDVLLDRLFESTESKRDKRAFEILGSVLSTITGVPSASDHRQLLEQVRLMK